MRVDSRIFPKYKIQTGEGQKILANSLWKTCLNHLEGELTPQQFNTWIRPLHAEEKPDSLILLAPNQFVMQRVNERFIDRIGEIFGTRLR